MEDWIFKNFEIVALVVIALGSAIKQLLESAKAKREEQRRKDYGEETETLEEEKPDWYSDSIPQEFRPPPLPEPEPLVRSIAPPLQPDPDPEGELLRKQLEMQEKAKEFRRQQDRGSDKALQRTLELERRARSAVREKRTDTIRAKVRTQLAHPSSARQAIVLQEVLGKPVGMR